MKVQEIVNEIFRLLIIRDYENIQPLINILKNDN